MEEENQENTNVEIQTYESNPLRDLIMSITNIVADVVKDSEGDLPITESRPEVCHRCGTPLDGSPGELNIPDKGNVFKRYYLCRHCSQRAITL